MGEGRFGELKKGILWVANGRVSIFFNLSCILSGELQEVEQLEMDEHVLVPKSVHYT